jgi:peptidoglycan/xylan/chitin deacetylase (PgdA/CDA1 family)
LIERAAEGNLRKKNGIGKRRHVALAAAALACAVVAALLPGAAPASTPGLVVSLTFDDGYANQYTNAAPILGAHGMSGTFFVPSGFVGSSGYMTWSQVSALASSGNEIGGHTVDHVDLPTVSPAQARQEICADRDTLLQHGLAATDFAYPYGTFNPAVESIVQECGYDSARSTSWYGSTCGNPCTESIPPTDPYATTIVAFGGGQPVAAIENNIMTAETHGGWAQILIHQVCDNCVSNAMSPEDLSALLDWLQPRAAQGTVVKTVAQVIGGPVNPPVDPNAAVPAAPALGGASGGAGSVALQWSAPVSDGGSAITGYNIYRGTASGGETLLTQVGNVTSYTDTSVTNGATYYYKVSAVNAVGESALSNELSATASGATSVIVSDQFDRTLTGGFGIPDVGPAWSVSSTAQTKVANGEGVIYGWTSGNKDIQAWIPTSANDMDILARIRLSAQNPTGANYQARIVARAQTDARNGYTAVITHTSTGAVKWSLNRVVNAGGSGTLTLGSGTLLSSGAAGTKWWIRLDVQGTQIKARFWQDGTTEPTTWKANASDSQWTSGRPALGVYVGSGLTSPYPDTGFDNYTAAALP